ncbi:hypothetical protein IRJ41_023614 [Triplophysa rosa]|uniref:Uncharacterized protein n=1 Tax=Triplophysa rosa TaxID=992332 RepID=A0A9W7X6S6_TRIRA|nr:hypothetical protein IRJ41_023614 [Triplophysa rosa]
MQDFSSHGFKNMPLQRKTKFKEFQEKILKWNNDIKAPLCQWTVKAEETRLSLRGPSWEHLLSKHS